MTAAGGPAGRPSPMRSAAMLTMLLSPALLSLAACASAPPPEAEPAPPSAPGAAPAAALDGGEWRVFEIGGQGVVADSAPTLQFAAGRLSGTSGCNRFMGGYVLGTDGGSLRAEQLASTMMACPEPLMQQEDRYLRLLGQVRRYRVDGGVLTLTGDDGQSIRARK